MNAESTARGPTQVTLVSTDAGDVREAAPGVVAAGRRGGRSGAASPESGRPAGQARSHIAAWAAVLVLHAGMIALLLLFHARERVPKPMPPIVVQMISDAPSHAEPPSVAPPVLERPRAIPSTPDLPLIEPSPTVPVVTRAPTATAAVAPRPENQSPAPAEPPVTRARFDAAYLKNPPPAYPAAARRQREQGTVTLRVLVLREGTAAELRVEHSSGSPRLDEAALEAVRHWRFIPAHRGNETVESWVLVPVGFELQR